MKIKLISAVSLLTLAAAMPANAADVIVHRHITPAVIVKPVDTFSWTGIYLGAQGSYQWGKHDVHVGATNLQDFSLKENGAGGGLFAGFNSNMLTGAVFGIETDILWNKIKGDFNIAPTGAGSSTNPSEARTLTGTFKEKWSGATRVRLGFAQDKILPYLAGGIAYSNIETNATLTPGGTGTPTSLKIDNHSETLVGWTAGAGVDCAVADNLLVRLEYRYNDFGKKELAYNPTSTTFHYNMKHRSQDVRVGVAYKF